MKITTGDIGNNVFETSKIQGVHLASASEVGAVLGPRGFMELLEKRVPSTDPIVLASVLASDDAAMCIIAKEL